MGPTRGDAEELLHLGLHGGDCMAADGEGVGGRGEEGGREGEVASVEGRWGEEREGGLGGRWVGFCLLQVAGQLRGELVLGSSGHGDIRGVHHVHLDNSVARGAMS